MLAKIFNSALVANHKAATLILTLTYTSSSSSTTSQPHSHNAIIRSFGYDSHNAVLTYMKMLQENVHPNQHTFPLLLKSKTKITFQIFTHIIKFGYCSDHYLGNSLIRSFSGCGHIEAATQVFDEMSRRDIVTYTALMDGYVKNDLAFRALEVFLEMRVVGVEIDGMAVVSVLRAVGALGCVWIGRWVHGFYVESGRVVNDVYIGSALIDMYSKCGYCEDAVRVFQETPVKNVVCWSALLAGYVKCGRFEDTLRLFQEMLREKIEPNEIVLASVLMACANLGALDQGKWVDEYIVRRGLELNSVLGTSLIDMYSKCGCIEEAFSVFQKLKVKDVYPWTALIGGLAMNGDASGALNAFRQMTRGGIQPSEVTFLAVLSACSHGGRIDEGKELFASMECVYGVKSCIGHYGCMVDLLGRAGELGEAVNLIKDMPMEPSAGIWGALFGACMIHKEFELGKIVGNYLIKLMPTRSGTYALLANLYSNSGDGEAAANVRKKLKGVGKAPGCSWISMDGVVCEFVSFDKSDLASESVYDCVDRIMNQIKQIPVVLEGGLLII